MKNIKKSTFNFMRKFENTFKVMLMGVLISTMYFQTAYATQPKIVSGTVNLLKNATSWLMILIPLGAGLFLGFHAFMKSISDDQAVIAEKNKMMKNVLIGAVIATTASGLATFILNYYN